MEALPKGAVNPTRGKVSTDASSDHLGKPLGVTALRFPPVERRELSPCRSSTAPPGRGGVDGAPAILESAFSSPELSAWHGRATP